MIQIQALGDSMIKRLNYYTKNTPQCPLVINRSIGLSAARVHEVKQFLKLQKVKFETHIPLLIFLGTNDIFKDTGSSEMCSQFKSLLKLVRRTSPGITIIIVQLPAYPRAQFTPSKLQQIDKFNIFLGTLKNENTKIVSTQNLLHNEHDFHKYYKHNGRLDNIHLNDNGNQKVALKVIESLK